MKTATLHVKINPSLAEKLKKVARQRETPVGELDARLCQIHSSLNSCSFPISSVVLYTHIRVDISVSASLRKKWACMFWR